MKCYVKNISGFTLVELMITLAVIAVASVIVLPQMGQLTQSNKMTEQINILSRDINYARSEAVTRGAQVDVISNNGADWTQGWAVTVLSTGEVLRQFGAAGTTVVKNLALTETNPTPGTISFRADGSVGNTIDLALCDNTSASTKKYGRQLSLSPTGRIQILNKKKSDGTTDICP